MSEVFEDLSALIEKHRRRAKDSKYLEAQRELSGELYPLLSTMVETIGERFDEVEANLEGLIEESMSILQPDLTGQIVGTFAIAAQLIDAVEGGKETKEIIAALREAMKMTEGAVLEATVGGGEEEEEEEEEEGEEEDEEEGEDEPEAAPEPVDTVNTPEPTEVK